MVAEQQARARFASDARWNGKRVNHTAGNTAALNAVAFNWAPADPRYQSLFNKVYFPIGGMEQIVRAFKSPKKTHTTNTSKERSKPKRKSGFKNLMKIATVFDYHHRELSPQPKKFGVPSIEKACEALSEATKPKGKNEKITGFSRGQIQELLKEHRNALALLYGAHCIPVDDTSLLDLLLGKALRLDHAIDHMPDWLCYAKYFHQEVLLRARGDWAETFSPELPAITTRQPPLAHLDAGQIASIEKAFSADQKSKRS